MPHRLRGTGRTAASSVLGRGLCFEWPYLELHTCPRRESLPSQYTQPAPTRLVAATTAPAPSSNSAVAGVRRYSSGCPSKRSERSIIVSSQVTVRRECAFGPGTNSQTGRERRPSHILLSFSTVQHIQRSTKTQQLTNHFTCRGKQSTPLARYPAGVPKKPKKEADGAAWLDAVPEVSLADEVAADENDDTVES
jgi:hypothetical protein